MNEIYTSLQQHPITYILAIALLCLLLAESANRIDELRWGFAGIFYLTIALWYLVDPLYRPDGYRGLTSEELFDAYLQVIVFLISFRFLLPLMTPNTPSRLLREFDPNLLNNGLVAKIIFFSWVVIFTIGVSRINFNVIGALFPMRARADWTSQLFARRRIGGSTDFLVSVCGYLYNFICSMFGMMAVASKDRRIRWLMILMMCISWPSFILNGARNQIISVAMPSILSILVLKRWTRSGQVVFLIFCFVLINTVMLTVIRFRNVGLDQIFLAENSVESISKTKHLGMNMTEELVMINRYQADGQLPVEWGYNYYANAVNFVPRGLWKDKPIAGDRFAELRMGFYGATIAGTASNGIVGQGVANFGKWLGPIAPAFIVLYLCRRLCMLLNGGNLFLRSCLVLLSLGTLPNLGRDITLIALWPIIFGTIAVIASEGYIARGERAMQLARERRIARSLPR